MEYTTMELNFTELTIEEFLQNYWQQKPVLIKGGLKNFENPLEPEELAGLATEDNIESRLIYQDDNGSWQAESGPFEDYSKYGEKNWSLVVQSVNHWLPAAQDFARLFDFVPQWRFDDIMVSFAAAGGGVGPHYDNYDVFICQGSGSRRWKVGAKDNNIVEVIAHEKLLHVKPFEPIIDEIVEAGDVLYIPPGFPHEGVSIDSSMSFSVGYKATNSTELFSGFADYLIDFEKKPALLNDAQRPINQYGEISRDDFGKLKIFLQDTLNNDKKLEDYLGIYLSQSRSELDLAEDEYEFEEWLAIFKENPLQKLYAVKTLYLPESIKQGIFYVDGEAHQLNCDEERLKEICNCKGLHYSKEFNEELLQWLWNSTNRGYWYFD